MSNKEDNEEKSDDATMEITPPSEKGLPSKHASRPSRIQDSKRNNLVFSREPVNKIAEKPKHKLWNIK
jgi:hypothetical protein